MRLGFVGLGQMGKYCALNLLKKRKELFVCDINPQATECLVAKGAISVDSYEKLAGLCDVIFLCLPDGNVVEEVLFGDNGLHANLSKEKIIVDLSTVDYLQTMEIANRVNALGADFLDAPISGMEAKAESGELSIMCGGARPAFDKVYAYLEYIGTSIVLVGSNGCGQLAKTINNVLYNINMAGLAEILPFAVKMGLDPEKVGILINAGTGRSYSSEYFIPRILNRDFSYGFTLDRAYKDMQSACTVSAKMKIPTPVLSATMLTYQMSLLCGHGNEYKGAMIKIYEDMLGVKFCRKNTCYDHADESRAE